MKTTTLQLLPTTSYGTPSGNYDGSSLDFASIWQKAAAYYLSNSSLQTVAFFVTGFEGHITIQASLDANPTQDAQWFDVYELPTDSSALTVSTSENIRGNFTWIRARVSDFTAGTITKVTLSY